MRGAIPPLSQYVFMAWFLVKHRDDFTLPQNQGIERYLVTVLSIFNTLDPEDQF
jgi:hypothetical protein